MNDLFKILHEKRIRLPESILGVLDGCKSFSVFNTTEKLADAATNGREFNEFEVKYDDPGTGEYIEAIVNRVTNGISVNYSETYMRRRDPATMVIADDKATDKRRFKDKFGYEFSSLREETFDWLKKQDLALFFYFAGREGIGSTGMAIVPANAAFFAMGLSMLQSIIPYKDLKEGL